MTPQATNLGGPTNTADKLAEPSWQPISTAPNGVVILTKIDGPGGERNVQRLRRDGRMWFVPDGSAYVYYSPTHWAAAALRARSGEGQ